jgi:hypothetical protein
MAATTSGNLSLFSRRWLAETIRIRELVSPVEDAEAVSLASAQSTDVEERILLRAHFLAERDGSLTALLHWRQHMRWALVALLVLAALGGFGSALAVLGDGSRPVNVVWATGSLLGLNLLMLFLWALNLIPRESPLGERGGLPGRIWFWISRWSGRRAAQSGAGGQKPAVSVSRAFAELLSRSGGMLWCLSTVTHVLWLAALSGALLGLLLSLALRSYVFIWETTILPADTFVSFISASGWLPAQLGFAVPAPDAVRASSLDLVVQGPASLSAATQPESLRREWASWLSGVLLVYGLLPRLLLALLCRQLLRLRLSRLRLDRSVPAYASLAARLRPVSAPSGVQDPDSQLLYRTETGHSTTPGTRESVMIGMELGEGFALAAETGVDDARTVLIPQVDSREQRRHALQVLNEDHPARLLVVCNARLSPDRGALNWLADASWHAAETRVLLMGGASVRQQSWQESLAQIGLTADRIFSEPRAAGQWVQHGEH